MASEFHGHERAPRSGPRLEVFETAKGRARRISDAEIDRPTVILVHGFTSSTAPFHPLGSYLFDDGWNVLLFEYDSYRPIHRSARSLRELLQPISDAARARGVAFVAHSLGGLVTRKFLMDCHFARETGSEQGKLLDSVLGCAFLGTPHDGTLVGKRVRWLLEAVRAMQKLGPVSPYWRSSACDCALELTKADAGGAIDRLNANERAGKSTVPYFSISAGLPHLEFAPGFIGSLRDKLVNHAIQKALGKKPNDGLVLEESANVAAVLPGRRDVAHGTHGGEFDAINHTYLPTWEERWIRIREFLNHERDAWAAKAPPKPQP